MPLCMVGPKFDFYILTPVTLKLKSIGQPEVTLSVGAHMLGACTCKFGDRRSVTCRDNTYISIFCDDQKPAKVGHTDLVFMCHEGSLVGLCVPDYKSLCASVTICATWFTSDRQTDRHTDNILTS